jgi:hypothetical protein
MDAEDEVRNFVVYSFQTMRKFRVLNPEQQFTARSLLVEFAQHGTSEFTANLAKEAVTLIDRRRYYCISTSNRMTAVNRLFHSLAPLFRFLEGE